MDISDVTLAMSYVEEVFKRTTGSDVPLSTKTVVDTLLREKNVSYDLGRTPSNIRLGVLYYYALLTNLNMGYTGCVFIEDGEKEKYINDRYGPANTRAQDIMDEFNVWAVTELPRNFHPYKTTKTLFFGSEEYFKENCVEMRAEGYQYYKNKGYFHPFLVDDGRYISFYD